MLIEFYSLNAPRKPLAADIHISNGGIITYNDHVPRTKGVLRVVVETGEHGMPNLEGFSMFRLIFNHQMVTVSFHGFEQPDVTH